jgi:iron complex transport system substrate-binding protein
MRNPQEFSRIDSSYQSLVKMAAVAVQKPSVIIGLPWKDTWYVSGGRSYASRLISDAGGDYLWKDDLSAEAVPLDLESVFSRAVRAEIWINPGAATSLDELIQYDSRFGQLAVVNQGNVYNNNNRMSRGGG